MVEDCSLVHKDAFGTKPHKKYPILLRTVVLTVVMISSIYICSICLRQKGFFISPNMMRVEIMSKHCQYPGISASEIPYIHYPKPTNYTRDDCACIPVRYFAILSMQRSGSGWFETLLNSHINISSNGEIFSVKERRSNISTIIATLDKVYNLDWYSSASKNECTAAVGLKWMLNQGLMMNHEGIVEYFQNRGVSVIFLLRRNLLRRWVSILANSHDREAKQLNGTHKAHVHSRNEADILARFKPLIDVRKLILDIKQTSKWSADALQYFNGTRHIILYYEDLILNQTKLMDVLNFLRVPRRELKSRHVKIHTRPLSEQIENWDVVSQSLKGTEFESFLQFDYGK
ncbi:uncharacterized protein LOC110035705 isoform X1 [Phalaenopsis equestris]|uniref:uncharacterized protein LOC110035705 isoform X1 n=1 Tax=Phalaenopsis equestris TaxID=78828 RepID=UPI0009E25A2F|nr:uncharacterized protein LOC110035705 isoform X1 [Phalaenopsis equestris]